MDKMPEVDIEEEEEEETLSKPSPTPDTPTEMHEFKMLPLFMDFEDFVNDPFFIFG